jgi:small subunit ribosomal protein S6
MPLYEHVFLSRQDVSAQQVEELTAQLKGVIEQMGGKVTKVEQWGVKTLSYRMRKNRKAHYTMFNVDAAAAALNEIERQERLNEDVLRYLTVRVDEHEEGPSAMMRKVDRDRERDERGFGFRGERGGGFRDRGGGGGYRGDRDREGGGGYRGDRDRDGPRPPRDAAPDAAEPATE